MRLTGAVFVMLIGLAVFMPVDHTLSSSAQPVDWAPQGDASDVTSMPEAVPDRGGDPRISNSCLLDPDDNPPGSLDPLLTVQQAAQDALGRSTLGVCVPNSGLSCGGSDTWNNGGVGSTDQIDSYSCTAWNESGPEYTYTFMPTVTCQVDVLLSNMTADLDVFVLDDSWEGGCNSENCIAYGNIGASFSAVAGGIYHIVVDGWDGAVGDYTISVTCADPPEIDVSPASVNVAVPVGGSNSAALTIANLGDLPLSWNLSLSTGGTSVPDTWTAHFDWYCVGSLYSTTITFASDGTFVAGGVSSGTWTQINNAVVFTFSDGQTVFSGYIAGDVMAGTMSSYGTPGCWEATRGATAQTPSVGDRLTLFDGLAIDVGARKPEVVKAVAPAEPSLQREPDLAWMSVTPTSGSVAGGGADSVTVGVDGAQYTTGEYGLLRIYSNDANEALTAVPVAVTMQALVKVGTATALTGGSVVAPVTASLPSGKALGAFNLYVFYTAAVVQATACSVDAGFLGACNAATLGVVAFSGASATGQTGDVNLGSITFQAVGAAGASSVLDPYVLNFADPGGVAIPYAEQDGSIVLMYLGDVNCDYGVNATDALFILQYSVGMRGGGAICPTPGQNAMLLPACNVSGDGACNSTDALFILQCNVGIHNPFCPAQAQAPTDVTPAEALLEDATISIGSASIPVGGSATVPITAILPPGVSLAAFNLSVAYDPALLSLTGCVANPALGAICFNPSPGVVNFGGATLAPQSGTVQLGEVSFQRLAVGSATLTLNVTNFANAAGDQIPRVVTNGVVGDPLAVTLASFTATSDSDHVLVTWETVSELDTTGFNLYRSESADVAGTLLASVPSQAPGGTQGATYRYEDEAVTAGQTYWYWLEDIDLSGATALHGPVSVAYQAPTAVALTTLSASPVAGSAVLPALAACLAALGGGLLVRRRKL